MIYNIQVKKKEFKINAKIEDVGLNEDLKSTETRNGHFFRAFCLFLVYTLTTIKENNSSYPCTDYLECN